MAVRLRLYDTHVLSEGYILGKHFGQASVVAFESSRVEFQCENVLFFRGRRGDRFCKQIAHSPERMGRVLLHLHTQYAPLSYGDLVRDANVSHTARERSIRVAFMA